MKIRKVELSEADTLLQITTKTFLYAFAHLNKAEDIKIYCDSFLTINRITTEINNTDSDFYFVVDEDDIIAYLKLNYAGAQTEFKDSEAVEIERIYVLAEHQGKQIGQQMLDFAVSMAQSKQLKYIWLGVWENNSNAIRFYRRNGFEVFDSHYFMLGNDKQTDLLMKRLISI
ncbi:GNAT family N-acetyltransferase [Mucilaginibacter sp. HMF5004]|uniref:GNAT family N-acetyltransferase n=1 Tax=Mucilaginibacter rivuli TaxID=2857527 RepID=UPI001C5FED21|nr:GNAT family N-acetyltransferase [Mucilaginibacter rivuli]MBW4891538.1 GNAT family N-acetyltransferase [Mucilaginibacter rivuli]